MKKILVFLMVSFVITASAQSLASEGRSVNEEISYNNTDTAILQRLNALEKKLVSQEKKLKMVEEENAKLKNEVVKLKANRSSQKKKFTVNRVGSKQWVRDHSTEKEVHDSSVKWDSIRR